MGRKKDKKTKEFVEEKVVVEEPQPEPTPEPPKPEPVIPDDKKVLWKAVTLETKDQITDLFNSIEALGFTIIDFDFEYNFRVGTIEVIYKVSRG